MNPESAHSKIDQMEDRLKTHTTDISHLDGIFQNQIIDQAIDIARLKSDVRSQTDEVNFLKRRLDRLDFFASIALGTITVHLLMHAFGWV